MTEDVPDYKPVDLKGMADVSHPEADSIQFVTVPEKEEIFLYLWNTERDEPVTSVIGFTAEGVEHLQNWLTNADIEARNESFNNYGKDND